MRGDRVIHTQLLMAQAFGALADHVAHSSGYVFTPLETLPAAPVPGTVVCLDDASGIRLMFFNGTAWKAIA